MVIRIGWDRIGFKSFDLGGRVCKFRPKEKEEKKPKKIPILIMCPKKAQARKYHLTFVASYLIANKLIFQVSVAILLMNNIFRLKDKADSFYNERCKATQGLARYLFALSAGTGFATSRRYRTLE